MTAHRRFCWAGRGTKHRLSRRLARHQPCGDGDNFILFVGNWSRYVIVDRVGMSVELIPHLFGDNNRPTGQRGLYAWMRTGAESVDDNAFRVLSIPTTA